MNETTKIDNCERAGELVAYFYGEASPAERESFDTHLANCGACRDELVAFAGVREAVGHWRAEILNDAQALPAARTPAPYDAGRAHAAGRAHRGVAPVAAPQRAALAALGEFFKLSPVWLRAGLAAATVAVCAFVALAVVNAEVRWDERGVAFSTRLRSKTQAAPPTQIVAPAGKVYTQAELEKLVAERDAALRELEDTRAQLDESREANLIAAVETLEPAPASKTTSSSNDARRERRASPAARANRRREERDEEDVLRLYDLLTEAN